MASLMCFTACWAPCWAPSPAAARSSDRPGQACRRLAPAAATHTGDLFQTAHTGSSRGRVGNSGSLVLARRRELLGAAAALSALLSLPCAATAAEVPKAYEDTALKLISALREAISTDLSDAEEREVRRAADPAKNLVRQFLTRWRGDVAVEGQESYSQLSAAIQQLGAFYMQNGQRARLTPEVGQRVLDLLDAAEAALPQRDNKPSLLPFF